MKELLLRAYDEAASEKKVSLDANVSDSLVKIVRNETNKAPVRFLLSGLLAKSYDPKNNLKRPYRSHDKGAFSCRSVDESVVQPLIFEKDLPCNRTTAFLTPAFRTISKDIDELTFMKCRPHELYEHLLEVINYIEAHPSEAWPALVFVIRELLHLKSEQEQRQEQLVKAIKISTGDLPPSSEEIVRLISLHLQCNNSSRLPVLVVSAAYDAVASFFGEQRRPLYAHNAADKQTGAHGDIEITLINDESIVTCYEMKDKRVTVNDVFLCMEKIAKAKFAIDNYIIVTTELISPEVMDVAKKAYRQIGVEIAVLDCIGFIRHFLHFFHRFRGRYIDCYQNLVLSDSAVKQSLKEIFLTLRLSLNSDSQD